ncbi:hypothetical protein M758_1G153600 [Ceratodon purpureus]|nr:hypothetical protein M758_1G153600 [Ceratodon purpureus]
MFVFAIVTICGGFVMLFTWSLQMSGTFTGTNRRSAVRRRSGLGRQPDMEGLEEIGHSSEVANVIPSSTQGDIDLGDYLSAGDLPIDFTSVQRLKNICSERYERLVDETTTMATEYLVFRKVTKDDLVKIDRSHCDLRIRIFYDFSMELLIVKLMVGKAHEWVSTLFAEHLREKVRGRCGDFYTLCDMGAFRCTSAMGRAKEPDVALVPMNRQNEADWPSCVIEVGVSESLAALKNDAHFWILHSGGLTRVVILIAVDPQTRTLTIERWGDKPPAYPSHVTGGVIRPRMAQCVTIDINGVIGAPLDVPSGLIFDVGHVPTGVLASDFSFDANELSALYTRFWGMLR